MKPTLRTKLLAIVAIAGVAFVAVIVASTVASNRTIDEVEKVEAVYLPLVELGPKILADFDDIGRAYQDAVAANDLEALATGRAKVDELLRDLDAAGAAVDPLKAVSVRKTVQDYAQVAHDVSRRLIGGETGEGLVEDMAKMQARQKVASDAVKAVASFDRDALRHVFDAIADAASTARDVRLYVGIACLGAVLFFCLWLARGVLRSIAALDEGFKRFGEGDFARPIPVSGGDELARASERANEMAKSLEKSALERRRSEWLEAGESGLARELRGELGPDEVAKRALEFLAGYLQVPVAALYQADSNGTLRLRACHAAPSDACAPPAFEPGEGIVGQAATKDDIVVLPGPPEHYLRARSALGEAAPTALVLVPLVRAGHVSGVIELGLFKPWGEREQDLLLATRETLAIALDVARANAETRTLLAETQALARRLATQDEELRAVNEELQTQQEELRQTNEELNAQALENEEQRRALGDRNDALDEARKTLQQKNDQLATMSAYKSQFLTNMSHELRTPLNSMLLLSNLMAENETGNLGEKQVEYCRTIYSAGKDLLALINQVLDLAKVESGKQEVRRATVRLADLADRARRVFEPQTKDKGLGLAVEIEAGLPESIYTDQQRVDQILTNLIGNAVKFTNSGSIRVRIARPTADVCFRRSELEHDDVIAFAVTDSGPGIASEDQDRIFDPFEQLDAKTDRRYGGTGLGLALTRELATLLGGEIQLKSQLGVGSTFVFYLPERVGRSRRQMARIAATTVPPRDDRNALVPGEPWLLVIEDDTGFAHTFGEVIHGHGLKFLVASSRDEALRLARQEPPPNGIIMDVGLPDTNGFDLMEELRSDAHTADIPVHFVTAVDAAERGLELGAVGYLLKPTLRRDLVRVVESLVPQAKKKTSRILVVEDDAMTGESLLKMLASEQLEAQRVTNAADALKVLAEQSFGCMVLDLTLPDMDGLELLERIQQQRPSDMPSVVVYTARALNTQEAKRLEAYTEAIVLKEGPSAERVINEVKLFVRRLKQGTATRRITLQEPRPGDLRLKGKKALVVDDDMRTVYALTAALRSKGMEVFVADNGKAALEVLSLRPAIDIVLMDIMMPEMDGYEAMRRIRSEARFGALPIIALTAKAMKGDEEKCLQAGANAYMPKPIDATRLFGLMHTQLQAPDVG